MYLLYGFATPNSIKPVIALEELGLDYKLQAVNVRKGEQTSPRFVALNPNAKVPVLTVDDAGRTMSLTESAAILVYLAERHGALLPVAGEARARVFEQLFFHASGISPAFGQAGYFRKLAPELLPHAVQRFHGEARRTLAVLDGILARHEFVAGDAYSIADIAHFGWIWRRAFAGVDFTNSPHVERWFAALSQRPVVRRALARVEGLLPSS
jgi:GST-like protein